jgi:isopentenyl diphosphate isomerase/L-lactate dehydrogenase-like FMN-dependent dehydrogenase
MPRIATLEDVRRRARRRLPRMAFDFIDGGADREITLRANTAAFESVVLRPRHLVDVTHRSPATTVLGEPVALPVLIAPTGMARIAHPAGDLAGARAATAAGTIFTLSTMSSHSLEEVRAAAAGPLWFQIYLWPQRAVVERLVDRAQAAGYRALVVTVDVPVAGNRLRDVANGFSFPPRVRPSTAADLLRHPRWLAGLPSAMTFANVAEQVGDGPGRALEYARLVNRLLANPGADWGLLAWLRERWPGPLLIKGTLTGEDARLAIEHGIDGIVVSNHGGRQLDGAPASLHALAEVVEAVAGRAEVLLDGGVRSGSDVVTAVAMGARAVLIGRPWLFGLAIGGEDGVALVLEILREEIDRTLALTGRTGVADLGPDLVGRRPAV